MNAIPDGLPLPRRRHAMAVIVLGITLATLDATIVNLALPAIARDLQVPGARAVWVVSAYQVALLALLLPCATLGDLWGYRRVYLAGLLVFVLASLGCVLSRSLVELTVCRAVQGMGAAGLAGVNTALVRRIYPAALLGRGMALNALVVAAASVGGPAVAAAVLSVADWPWLFALNLPLGALMLLLGPRLLPGNACPPQAGVRLSWLDVFLNMATFCLVVMGADALGVGAGGHQDGRHTGGLLLAAGLMLGFWYVRRQGRQPLPLLPVDLLAIEVIRLSACASVAAFAGQMLASVALPFLLLEGLGHGLARTGLLLAVWPLATALAAPLAARLMARHDASRLGVAGMLLMALGLLALALLHRQAGLWPMALCLAACGAGFGLFQTPNNVTMMRAAPAARSGGASGMQGTARILGQTLAVVMVAAVFGHFGAQGGPGPAVALALGAGMAVLAALFSALRKRAAPPPPPPR